MTVIHRLYESGDLSGVVADPEAEERFDGESNFGCYADVLDSFGLWTPQVTEGLYLPYLAVVMAEAARLGIRGSLADLSKDKRINPWPESQSTGDCVAHRCRNACDAARACDQYVDGDFETWVCRTATEPIYGHRGHRGAGANCSRLLSYVRNEGGMMLRKKYEIEGYGELDLSEYKASIGMGWGGSGVPKAVREEGQKHQVLDATRVKTREELRQAYRNGHCVGGCSSIAFSRKRNEDGVSKVTGSWAHAMLGIGFDEREVTIKKYGEPLVLEINSWGKWNSGGRKILNSDIYIPHGSCWVKESDYVRRKIKPGSCFVVTSTVGWKPVKLIDLGHSAFG